MSDIGTFNESFQSIADPIMDGVCEDLFNQEIEQPTREQIIAQLLMDQLFAHPCDPQSDGNPATLTTAVKESLVRIAAHMGPDYAQALYHAAVFITKVA